jgi:hypothetical protein
MIEIQASIISHSSILRKLNSGLLKVGVFFAFFFAFLCTSSVRALPEERRDYLASLFVNLFSNETLKYNGAERLFSLFAEHNDVEIIILKFHSLRSTLAEWYSFKNKYNEV